MDKPAAETGGKQHSLAEQVTVAEQVSGAHLARRAGIDAMRVEIRLPGQGQGAAKVTSLLPFSLDSLVTKFVTSYLFVQ